VVPEVVRKGPQVNKDHLDPRENRVHRAFKVFKENRENKVYRVFLENKG